MLCDNHSSGTSSGTVTPCNTTFGSIRAAISGIVVSFMNGGEAVTVSAGDGRVSVDTSRWLRAFVGIVMDGDDSGRDASFILCEWNGGDIDTSIDGGGCSASEARPRSTPDGD
jgi:hypothetical protein